VQRQVDRVVNKVRRRIDNVLFVQGWLENHVTKTVEYVNIPRIARRPSKKYCDSMINDHFLHRFHRLAILIQRPTVFHSGLKTSLFCKSVPPQPSFSSPGLTPPISLTAFYTDTAEHIDFFYFLVFLFFTC